MEFPSLTNSIKNSPPGPIELMTQPALATGWMSASRADQLQVSQCTLLRVTNAEGHFPPGADEFMTEPGSSRYGCRPGPMNFRSAYAPNHAGCVARDRCRQVVVPGDVRVPARLTVTAMDAVLVMPRRVIEVP